MSRAGRVALTREGAVAAGLAVLVAMAAANTGANLLFLVLGVLSATILVSLVAGQRDLRALEARLELPSLVEAGGPCHGRLVLTAPGRGARSVSVRGTPFLPRQGIYVEAVAGRGSVSIPFEAEAPRRGVYREMRLELVTCAPVHFAVHRRRLVVAIEVDVHPMLHPRSALSTWVRGALGEGSRDSPLPGEGGSLRNLRPYAPGDNPRRVHWRATARSGTLVVREDHAERRPSVVVMIDPETAPGEPLERALRDAASATRDALAAGIAVDLRGPGAALHLAEPGDLGRGLRWFARATPPDPGAVRPGARNRGRRDPDPRGPVLRFGTLPAGRVAATAGADAAAGPA